MSYSFNLFGSYRKSLLDHKKSKIHIPVLPKDKYGSVFLYEDLFKNRYFYFNRITIKISGLIYQEKKTLKLIHKQDIPLK